VLPWGVIVYGAALSAVLALLLVLVLARERRPAVLVSVALATAAGPAAWNAILRAKEFPRASDTPPGAAALAYHLLACRPINLSCLPHPTIHM
jgi:hypothetical protein